MSKIFYPAIEDLGERKQGDPVALEIPCEPGEISDGYHTFNELYEHRYLLFCFASQHANLRREAPYSWKSKTHWIDNNLEPVWEGWFVAGIELYLKDGPRMITYHLPLKYWDLFEGIERETAPPHDGHTSQDVIARLEEWLKGGD